MRVGVAGAGAVGAHYGAMLARAGCEVRLLARGAHLQALRREGLRHRAPNGELRTFALPASDDPRILADCEVVLIACKTTQLAAMLDALADVLARDALVITLQNGVDAPAQAAAALPTQPIVAGSAFIGARIERPGTIAHTAAGGIGLAHWRGDPRGKWAAIAAAWARASVPVRIEENARKMLWRKMCWNCGFNALTALLGCEAHQAAQDPDAAKIALAAMQEVCAAAKAEGVALSPELPEQMLARTKQLFGVKTSMLQDLEAGRPTEIEAMNARIVRTLGKARAPVNATLAELVRAKERLQGVGR